jgi:hypothetical protein
MTDQPSAPATAPQWGIFELALTGPADGNPFLDHQVSARFWQGERTLVADGFYDGDGIYRIRFMPENKGSWRYRTASDVAALDGLEGRFESVDPEPGSHGPVRVADRFHFAYADGTPYRQIGTTCYAWVHQGDDLERQTLETLQAAPFNKLRMCIFPKHYRYNENEPEFYPYPLLEAGDSTWRRGDRQGSHGFTFDFDRFDPAFFRHLEGRIGDLMRLGIEADLILFHPYDRWGFSTLNAGQNARYLRYLVARLAAYRNVWWSMANEYDLMPQYQTADWDRFFQIVAAADPYGHLRSVHNCFRFYDHGQPWVTHCSVQHSELAEVARWRERYGKPVVVDECCYEGDIAETWGNITGGEMVHRFWEGTVYGGYVGHGDTFADPKDILWWAKGGRLRGESAPRLAFLRSILEAAPPGPLEPIPDAHPYLMRLAGGREELTLADFRAFVGDRRAAAGKTEAEEFGGSYAGVYVPHQYYLLYFGLNRPSEIAVNVPAGETYRAELIDTWEMTATPLAQPVTRGVPVAITPKPHQALRLQRVRGEG